MIKVKWGKSFTNQCNQIIIGVIQFKKNFSFVYNYKTD